MTNQRRQLPSDQNAPARTSDISRLTGQIDMEVRQSPDSYTIAEFCHSHGISKSFFYILMKTGRGPGSYTLGRRRYISKESAAAWRYQMEYGEPEAVAVTAE